MILHSIRSGFFSRFFGKQFPKYISLQGKSVAVVGNASSILDAHYGSLIDSHDIIIRMNRGVPHHASSQGSRTDILAFSTFVNIHDIYTEFNASCFIGMAPKKRTAKIRRCDFYPVTHWKKLYNTLGAPPSVGAMVLDFISSQEPRHVSIFGFDFKKTMSVYETKNHIGPHNYLAEEQFISELAKNNHWTIYSSSTHTA